MSSKQASYQCFDSDSHLINFQFSLDVKFSVIFIRMIIKPRSSYLSVLFQEEMFNEMFNGSQFVVLCPAPSSFHTLIVE